MKTHLIFCIIFIDFMPYKNLFNNISYDCALKMSIYCGLDFKNELNQQSH